MRRENQVWRRWDAIMILLLNLLTVKYSKLCNWRNFKTGKRSTDIRRKRLNMYLVLLTTWIKMSVWVHGVFSLKKKKKLYPLKRPGNSDQCGGKRATLTDHISVCKYHFPLFRIKVFWKNSSFQVWGKTHIRQFWYTLPYQRQGNHFPKRHRKPIWRYCLAKNRVDGI